MALNAIYFLVYKYICDSMRRDKFTLLFEESSFTFVATEKQKKVVRTRTCSQYISTHATRYGRSNKF